MKLTAVGFILSLTGKGINVIIDYRLPNKKISTNCGDLPDAKTEEAIEIKSIKFK